MQHKETIIIDSKHPALAGHFPGTPVVPAVVILEKVFEVLQKTVPEPIQVIAIPHAKFISPLKPGEALVINLGSEKEGEVPFTCSVDSRLISTGSLMFTPWPGKVVHE